MKAFARSLAIVLVGWCAALLPAGRAPWAAAMKAEVEVIEDGNAALSFALGCVRGTVRARIFTWTFVAQSVRFGTIGAMVAFSLLSAMVTKRMIEAQGESASVFGLTCVLFAAAAIWSHVRGAIALMQTACPMIAFYVLAYAFITSGHAVADEWRDVRLYRALAIEGAVIWGILLMVAVLTLRLEALSIAERCRAER